MAATEIAPSTRPLQFGDLVVLLRDTPPLAFPSTTELPPVSIIPDPVNPKGIAYHHLNKTLIVALARNADTSGQKTSCLKEVNAFTGNRAVWAGTFRMYRGVESKIAIVPAVAPGGFSAGDVFVGTGGPAGKGGTGNQIAKVLANGSSFVEAWAEPDSANPSPQGAWGGLAFDLPSGAFLGRLLVLLNTKKIFSIDSTGGTIAQVADLTNITLDGTPNSALGEHPEGIAVAPSSFGTHAGKAIIGIEGTSNTNGGKVFAVSSAPLASTLADLHSTVENLVFVPPLGGTFYLSRPDFIRETGNKILVVSASQFMGRLGQLIAVNERSGEVWAVAWTGSAYTQQIIGRVPGRWTSEGIQTQGTAVDQCCFAEKAPTLPSWTAFSEVGPAGFTTDQHVATTTQTNQNTGLQEVRVVARADGSNPSFTAGHLYLNTMTLPAGTWSGWTDWNFPGTTDLAAAAVSQEGVLHVIGVQTTTNDIYHKIGTGSWNVVPGGIKTTLAPGAAIVNGEVILCVKNAAAPNTLQINSFRPTWQRPWTGWSEVPGGDAVDFAPAVAAFQDELYLIRVTANKVFARARTATGAWSESAEIPGATGTNVGVGAAGIPPMFSPSVIPEIPYSRQLYLFSKAQSNNTLWQNVASEVGTWSGWNQFDAVSTTDRAMAACVTDQATPVVFLFVKGIGDKKIYWRKST